MPESPLAGYETNRNGYHPPHWEGWRVLRTLWLGSGGSGLFQEGSRLGDFVDTKENEGCIRAGFQAAVRVVDIDVGFSSLIFRFLPLCRGPLVIECCLSSRRIVKDKTVTAFPG